ncbi:MAG: multi-sensor hybrid histidine kinase, partial [Armatimonadetes bacterium]|nr:multi-sensor hybrid histidine kinase [Armatimonadota bacterium]
METSVTDVLEQISDAFYSLDTEWRFSYVNARAAARWGRQPAALIGRCFWTEFPTALGTRLEEEHRRAARERTPAQFELSSPAFGGWLALSIYPSDRGLSVYFRDVSSRTRAEHELQREEAEATLRRSERLYRALIQQAGEGVWLTDLSGRIHEVNPAACEMMGYSREELLQVPVPSLSPSEYVVRREADLIRLRAGETVTSERPLRCKDGRILQVEGTARLVSSDLVLSFTRDVTERQATQAALRASDERYRAFLAQSSEGIWRCELDEPIPVDLSTDDQIDLIYQRAHLAECNDAFARMYGLSAASDIVGARLSDLLVRTDPSNTAYLRAFIESGYRLENAESHEVDAEGNPKIFLNSLVGFLEEERVVRAWGLQRDVTEQRSAEEEVRRSESRFRTLAQAGEALFGTRDSQQSLNALAHLCVEQIADACFIDVLGDAGEIRRAAWAHRRAELRPVLDEIVGHVPTAPTSPHPVPAALFRGEVTLTPRVDAAWLARIASSENHRRLMEQIGARSLITVPIRAQGVILGAITVTLTFESAPRTFGVADLELIQEIARRAATAL